MHVFKTSAGCWAVQENCIGGRVLTYGLQTKREATAAMRDMRRSDRALIKARGR